MQTTQNPNPVTFDSPKGKGEFQLRVGPGPYIMKLARLERAPDGQFGPQIYWYWELHNTVSENGKTKIIPAQLNEDGSIFEWRERTSTKFGKNPKTGVVAASRQRAEALLKRDLDDDVDTAAIAQEIIGKGAFGYLTTRQGTDGNMYLQLSAIEPYKNGMQAPVQRIEEPSDDGDDGGDDLSDTDSVPF